MDAIERQVIGVLSAQPMAGAQVSEANDALPGYVVAATALLEPPVLGISDFQLPASDVAPSPHGGEGWGEGEHVPPHRNGKLRTVIECMLFVANEPMSIKQIAQTLDLDESRVDVAVASLREDLNCGHGLQLMKVAGGFQLCTRPEYSDYCAMVVNGSKKKLSKAALETLAVVAYRQPCTMPEIEAVRGVQIDGVIKTLMDRGLVKEAGRKHTPGRPILYATTPEFLEYFGLNDLSELPDIDLMAVEEVRALEAERETLQSN